MVKMNDYKKLNLIDFVFLAVNLLSTNQYDFEATVHCANDSIVDFVLSTPFFSTISVLYQVSNFTWGVNITWLANDTGKYMQLKKILLTFILY
jgi:hypothetical protein